jgi:flagellar hook-associated protein 1 FlgK
VNGGASDITGHLTGGAIQGLLNFRDGILNGARQQLGVLAVGMADTFNAQHQLGVDLNGVAGGDVFRPIAVKVSESYKNLGASAETDTINNISDVQPTEYNVYNDGTNWQVTKLMSGTVTQGNGPFDLDGLTIAMTGAAVEGDEFLVRPSYRAASLLDLAISAPADIASAAPIKSADTLSNTGSGTIETLTVATTAGLPLVADITLTFNPDAGGAGIPGFNVNGGPGGVLLYDPATEFSGKTLTLAGYGDVSFIVSGAPEAGDTFTLSQNTAGAGDNRNALLLAGLQNKSTLLKSTASYQDIFATTVSDIGIQTRQSKQSLETQTVLHSQAEDAHKAKSGVNLDEEAANLLRYQQAYQAAAKVITVSDEMFRALLNTFR